MLVCSDVVARGMQFDGVSTVINYTAPSTIKQYVHRAGRTARASATGVVLTLCEHKQQVPYPTLNPKIANQVPMFEFQIGIVL